MTDSEWLVQTYERTTFYVLTIGDLLFSEEKPGDSGKVSNLVYVFPEQSYAALYATAIDSNPKSIIRVTGFSLFKLWELARSMHTDRVNAYFFFAKVSSRGEPKAMDVLFAPPGVLSLS